MEGFAKDVVPSRQYLIASVFEDAQSELSQCQNLPHILSFTQSIRYHPDSHAQSLGLRLFKVLLQLGLIPPEVVEAVEDGVKQPSTSDSFANALQCLPLLFKKFPLPNEEITAQLLLLFETIEERLLSLYNAADFTNFAVLFSFIDTTTNPVLLHELSAFLFDLIDSITTPLFLLTAKSPSISHVTQSYQSLSPLLYVTLTHLHHRFHSEKETASPSDQTQSDVSLPHTVTELDMLIDNLSSGQVSLPFSLSQMTHSSDITPNLFVLLLASLITHGQQILTFHIRNNTSLFPNLNTNEIETSFHSLDTHSPSNTSPSSTILPFSLTNSVPRTVPVSGPQNNNGSSTVSQTTLTPSLLQSSSSSPSPSSLSQSSSSSSSIVSGAISLLTAQLTDLLSLLCNTLDAFPSSALRLHTVLQPLLRVSFPPPYLSG